MSDQLVGRARELELIATSLGELGELGRGRGRLFLLAGEPGIGKTSLADAACVHATSCGARVAWGRCWEAGGAPAFWPWTQALEQLGEDAGAIASAGSAVDGESARFAIGRALTSRLSALASSQPLFLVLDDLHVADRASLSALHFVARELRRVPLMIIGTYRDVEARLSEETDALLQQIAREGTTLTLRRLDAVESSALVRRTAGEVSAELHAAIFAATEGNPLFLDEVARAIAQEGRLAHAGAVLPIPYGVREAIRRRLALLDDEARRFLSVAALLGDELRADLIAAVSEAPLATVEDALVRAEHAGAIKDDRRRFTHALFREVLERDLTHSDRLRVHARASAVLLGLAAPPLVEIAHHLVSAGPEHAEAAVGAVERAKDLLLQKAAYDDAVALVERAQKSLALHLDRPLACRLALALGDALARAGRMRDGKDASAAAAALADELGDGRLLSKAALAFGSGWSFGQVDQTLVSLLERARAMLPESETALYARVEARLAGALQPADDPDVPIALARAAIARARSSGDDGAILDAIHTGMSALMDFAHPLERMPLNQELLERAERAGDRGKVLRANVRLIFDYAELGEIDRVELGIERYATLAEEVGHPQHTILVPMLRAMVHLVRDDVAAHEKCFAEAEQIVLSSSWEQGRFQLHAHALFRAILTKDGPEVRRLRELLMPMIQRSSPSNTLGFRCWTAWAAGDHEGARREAVQLIAGPLVRDAAFHALLADVLIELFDHEALRSVFERSLEDLRPYTGRLASQGIVGCVLFPPYDLFLGKLARAVGRVEEARMFFERALEMSERMRAPRFIAEIEHELNGLEPRAQTVERTRDVADAPIQISREEDGWRIRGRRSSFRLKDSRGLQILSALIAQPGVEVHALDLAGAGAAGEGAIDGGDAGELVDETAKRAYRTRLNELEGAIAAATAVEARERLLDEKEALVEELARGFGLGGRPRRAGAAAERARVAVQRRIKDAIAKIRAQDPELGEHLEWAVKTGATCVYKQR